MVTLLFIRHGPDEADGKHVFDQRISPKGKRSCRKVAKLLVKKYGLPTLIYYSPYKRCRTTLQEFLRVIESHKGDHVVKTEPAPSLGKFYTTQQRHAMKERLVVSFCFYPFAID